jgi:hypothetical protein
MGGIVFALETVPSNGDIELGTRIRFSRGRGTVEPVARDHRR